MIATALGEWASRITFADLPTDVVADTKLRMLDVIGLALAGSDTPFGRSTRAAAVALSPSGPSRIVGSGERVGVGTAAFANAAFAQALEFDDTHNESIVHMSSPSVAAALALSETRRVCGREAIVAIAVGNEISCRVGVVAPGQFHRRGFHPTGLFAPFGVTYAAGRLLGLDADTLARAAGICGSFAAGLLECWVDGTQSKFLHSGWAAQSGITAALLAQAACTGPPTILEGRFGLFASHLPGDVRKDFDRVYRRLGERLGEPQLVAQAVSGGARAASVCRRRSAPARALRHLVVRCRADRLSGRGVQRVDRLRAARREARARRPIRTRGSACSTPSRKRCTSESLARRPTRTCGNHGDPRAGAPRAVLRRSVVSPARADSRARFI